MNNNGKVFVPNAAPQTDVTFRRHENVHPIIVPIPAANGVVLNVIGGITKLELAAVIIAANGGDPLECVHRAEGVLALCQAREAEIDAMRSADNGKN